ncbi:hypothetical protein [Microbacterium trichothecenolyticum]|nr:hypothetical protein [Microbacterium trichothecenolyticum]
MFGPRTVARRVQNATYRIFGAEHATPGSVTPPVNPEREVEQSVAGVQQNPDSPSQLMIAAVERNRATGLSAGGTMIVFRTYDDAGTAQRSVEISVDEGTLIGGAALYGSTAVVATNHTDTDTDTYRAVDLTSGATRWSTSCAGRNFDAAPVVGYAGIWAVECDLDPFAGTSEIRGLDVMSGAVRWAVPGARTTLGGGSILQIPGSGTMFARYEYGAFDIATGAQVGPHSREFPQVDEGQGLLVTRGDGGVQTTDVHSGQRIFDLSAGDADRLQGLTILCAFDGRIWSWSDGGVGVSNARTGASDPLTPARDASRAPQPNIPLAVGRSWIVLGTVDSSGGTSATALLRDPRGSLTASSLPTTSP